MSLFTAEMNLHNLSVKSGLATVLILGALVLTLNFTQNGLAQSTQNINLTGSWKANDGGTYYIRNIGNNLWWLGVSGNNDGRTFSNVLRGYIHENNKTITSTWADIPRGTNEFYGTLTLSIDSDSMLHKVNETNYDKIGSHSCCFGASRWQKIS